VSARWRLALSYAGLVVFAGSVLLGIVWAFLLRYVPEGPIIGGGGFVPNRSDLVEAFVPRVAIAFAILVVIGLVGGWLLAGRMLAPLARIASVTRATAGGSLARRVPLDGPDDEFRELAVAFNQMLDRVESHVAEQRRFAANASHELRTPLATTRTLIDIARTDPAADITRTLERLRITNTRAIELTEALLMLSRVEQVIELREAVDLSLAAEEAEEQLVALAESRGVRLDVAGEFAAVRGSAALIGQLATNLVHNAIVHNVPSDGTVRVRTSRKGDLSVLVVENTGPLVPIEVLPTLVEPFRRAAGRTHTDEHAGVGLGLAIVQGIMRAHGGSLVLTSLPAGGLRAEASFRAV